MNDPPPHPPPVNLVVIVFSILFITLSGALPLPETPRFMRSLRISSFSLRPHVFALKAYGEGYLNGKLLIFFPFFQIIPNLPRDPPDSL